MKTGDWIGHGGDVFGYSNDAWYLPSADATITVTVNKGSMKKHGAYDIWSVIAEHLYPNSIDPAYGPSFCAKALRATVGDTRP